MCVAVVSGGECTDPLHHHYHHQSYSEWHPWTRLCLQNHRLGCARVLRLEGCGTEEHKGKEKLKERNRGRKEGGGRSLMVTLRTMQGISTFCKYAVFCLLLTGLFTQNSTALTSYSRQELLDVGLHNSNSFITDLQLIPEISKTPEAAHSSWAW